MEIDPQTVFNLMFTVIGVLAGWLLNNFRRSIDELKKEDRRMADQISTQGKETTDRLHRIEVLLSGKYMTRLEVEERVSKTCKDIFDYLRRIDAKLDTKMDKQ